MTDREIIIHLAEKVMGWTVRNVDAVSGSKEVIAIRDASGRDRIWYPGCGNRYWNPLESIADAFEVQAVVLAWKHADKYIFRMNDMACSGAAVISTTRMARFMLSASPRQRSLAIVEATK